MLCSQNPEYECEACGTCDEDDYEDELVECDGTYCWDVCLNCGKLVPNRR